MLKFGKLFPVEQKTENGFEPETLENLRKSENVKQKKSENTKSVLLNEKIEKVAKQSFAKLDFWNSGNLKNNCSTEIQLILRNETSTVNQLLLIKSTVKTSFIRKLISQFFSRKINCF